MTQQEIAERILRVEETPDSNPPFRCLPAPNEEWLKLKIERVSQALTEQRERDAEIADNHRHRIIKLSDGEYDCNVRDCCESEIAQAILSQEEEKCTCPPHVQGLYKNDKPAERLYCAVHRAK